MKIAIPSALEMTLHNFHVPILRNFIIRAGRKKKFDALKNNLGLSAGGK